MARQRPSAIAVGAVLAAVVGLGALLALLVIGIEPEANTSRPRVSAREARLLAEGGAAAAPPHGRPVAVNVTEAASGSAVPTNFMGLSFEASALPLIASYAHGGDLAALLRSLGHGVIRLGGVSVDRRVAWSPEGRARPSWADVGVTRNELADLAALARQSGWSVLLSVDLGHYDTAAAAREVASAHALLGNRLAGVAIGNEPDRYEGERLRGAGWGMSGYEQQWQAYSAAIRHAAPGVPIVAPDASSGIPPLSWVSAAGSLHPALLADHYYPLSSCGGVQPERGELLSPVTRAHENAMLSRLHAIARTSATPVRIDETGSISCHGAPGVSNSFASALWAADWTVRAMDAGIAGLNFHDLVSERGAYSPLVLASDTPAAGTRAVPSSSALGANPDWYALLLTAPLAGALPLSTSVNGDPNLTAAAFGSAGKTRARGDPVRVVLIDLDPPSARPLLVHLHVPAHLTGGSILRLMAASPAAQSHVALGAGEVAADGSWRPKLPLPRLYGRPGSLSLELPASSAALVTLEAGTPAGTR
jgi:hypothetical protein